ncbi:MAG: FGGY family carbohydrate kinase [Candidatus Korarchaeota archaeon]
MFLVFDIGTTVIKAIIFDDNGKQISTGEHEINLISQVAGAAEQKAQDWIVAISNATKDALTQGNISPNQIKGISIASQRGTVVPVKKDGTPLSNALTWMDSRISPLAKAHMEELTQKTMLLRVAFIKDTQPDVFNNADLMVTPMSYILHFLTGNWVESTSDAVYELYSATRKERVPLSFDLIDENKFPEIASPGKIVGEVQDSAARKLWIKPGIPVIMGAGDQQCAALGLGVIEEGQAKMTLGTGLFIDAVVENPPFEFFDPATKAFTLPHAIPDKFLVEAVLPGTGSTYKWFRDQIGRDVVEKAKTQGLNPYSLLDAEAEHVSPGADGLRMIPLQSFGKGVIKNFSFAHTRGHIIRAFFESVAMAARFMCEVAFGAYEIHFDSIRGDGGGFRGKVWRQIIADATRKTIEVAESFENSAARGASILAGVAIGVYPSFEDAVSKTVKVIETIPPGENAEVYDNIYGTFQEEFYAEVEKLEI